MLEIGTNLQRIQQINNLQKNASMHGINNLLELQIEGLRTEIELCFENLPSIDDLSNCNLNCDPDIFFEILIICVRNSVLKQQKFLDINFKLKKQRLINLLHDLKTNYDTNQREIAIV